MTTNRQQKREQRRRDKEARRRHRQAAEWERQKPARAKQYADDLRRDVARIEAKERMRRNNLAPLGLAAALITMCASSDKGNLP
jgi:hypothetical protein